VESKEEVTCQEGKSLLFPGSLAGRGVGAVAATSSASLSLATSGSALSVPMTNVAKPSPGRHLAKDKHKTLAALRPWEAEEMSRRTWYRRQREKNRER
jgi:hypothetical protein